MNIKRALFCFFCWRCVCLYWVLACAVPFAYAGETVKAIGEEFAECQAHFAGALPKFHFVPQKVYALCFNGFATLYSAPAKTALYSAHHLTKDEVVRARQLARVDSFHPEMNLPDASRVDNQDYKGYDYDRGHLVPNGDMADTHMQFDSFSFANIVPQNATHNRNIWRQIESHTRTLSYEYGESYVVTGTAFYHQQFMGQVAVPTHLYKAIYLPSQNIAAVYFSPNDDSFSYEIIEPAELTRRIGVEPFPSQSPNFDQRLFELDGQSDAKPSDELQGFWATVFEIVNQLWQKLSG